MRGGCGCSCFIRELVFPLCLDVVVCGFRVFGCKSHWNKWLCNYLYALLPCSYANCAPGGVTKVLTMS